MADTVKVALVIAITTSLQIAIVNAMDPLDWSNVHPEELRKEEFPTSFDRDPKCKEYLSRYSCQVNFEDESVLYSSLCNFTALRFALLPLRLEAILLVPFSINDEESVVIDSNGIVVVINLEEGRAYANYVVELSTTKLDSVDLTAKKWAELGMKSTIFEIKTVDNICTEGYSNGYIVIFKEESACGFGVVAKSTQAMSEEGITYVFTILGLGQPSDVGDITASRWGSFIYLKDKGKFENVIPKLYSGQERIAMDYFTKAKYNGLIKNEITRAWNKMYGTELENIDFSPARAWMVSGKICAIVRLLAAEADKYMFVTMIPGDTPILATGVPECNGNVAIIVLMRELYPTA